LPDHTTWPEEAISSGHYPYLSLTCEKIIIFWGRFEIQDKGLSGKVRDDMISLEDKVVIVTGASRGIGRAIALVFAKEKAKVILAARNKKELEKVAHQIAKLKG